jgi:hypothetical protein
MLEKLPFEVHPAAELFPLIEGEDFAALVEDIRLNGVNDMIVFWQGKLLDGRNRARACIAVGIDPLNHACDLDTEQVDPLAYVMSANLHRRHLTTGQRAMIAAKMKGGIEEKAKERKGSSQQKSKVENLPPFESGKSRDIAGQALKVSGKSVDAATKILQSGDEEVIAAVESGEMSLNAAVQKIAPQPRKAQPKEPVQKRLTKQQAAEKRKGSDDVDSPSDVRTVDKGLLDRIGKRLVALSDQVGNLSSQVEQLRKQFPKQFPDQFHSLKGNLHEAEELLDSAAGWIEDMQDASRGAE